MFVNVPATALFYGRLAMWARFGGRGNRLLRSFLLDLALRGCLSLSFSLASLLLSAGAFPGFGDLAFPLLALQPLLIEQSLLRGHETLGKDPIRLFLGAAHVLLPLRFLVLQFKLGPEIIWVSLQGV